MHEQSTWKNLPKTCISRHPEMVSLAYPKYLSLQGSYACESKNATQHHSPLAHSLPDCGMRADELIKAVMVADAQGHVLL